MWGIVLEWRFPDTGLLNFSINSFFLELRQLFRRKFRGLRNNQISTINHIIPTTIIRRSTNYYFPVTHPIN